MDRKNASEGTSKARKKSNIDILEDIIILLTGNRDSIEVAKEARKTLVAQLAADESAWLVEQFCGDNTVRLSKDTHRYDNQSNTLFCLPANPTASLGAVDNRAFFLAFKNDIMPAWLKNGIKLEKLALQVLSHCTASTAASIEL